MKVSLLALGLTLAAPAFAASYWDRCTSPNGRVRLDQGRLYLDGQLVPSSYITVTRVKGLSRDAKVCRLELARRDVEVFRNVVTEEHILFTVGNDLRDTDVVCQRGYDVMPTGDRCAEATLK